MRLAEIQAALSGGVPKERYDRTLFVEARNSKQWEVIKTSPFFQERVKEVRDGAVPYLSKPIKALPYSLFQLFWETGSRKEYEAEYFEHRDRMNRFAILALLDKDRKSLRALEDTIWAICDEYTWCLPAHLGDEFTVCEPAQLTRTESGVLKERRRDPQKMLDLFSAETAFALAEILSLLEEKLAPAVLGRGRSEIFRRVLQPYAGMNPMEWWEISTLNWAAVCAGSIGAAALYLIDDAAVLAPLLYRVLGTLDCYLEGFGPDGASVEGIDYWGYGVGFYTYFAALLKQRTAGRINLFQGEKIRKIALFQQKCYLCGNTVVTFSDASPVENYMPGLTHYLKSLYPEIQIPDRRYQAGLDDDGARRWAHAIRNFVWDNPEHPTGLAVQASEYLPDAQWFILKRPKRESQICFAAKGGHNDEPHNHNDIGSFLLHLGEERFLTDIGRGEYTRQYFREERYQCLCAGSQGHSVPIVAGEYQKSGKQYAARGVEYTVHGEQERLVMDIAQAYGVSNLQSLLRSFIFDGSKLQLHMEDWFEFGTVPESLIERLVTTIQPRIVRDDLIRLESMTGGVDILFDGDLQKLRIHKKSYTAHDLSKNEVFLIDFHLATSQPTLAAKFTFIPFDR